MITYVNTAIGVKCDQCGKQQAFNLKTDKLEVYDTHTSETLVAEMTKYGWTLDTDGKVTCPKTTEAHTALKNGIITPAAK